MFPHGVTITVIDTARDRHGDLTETPRGSIHQCGVAPETSVEDNDKREQVDTRATVYAPYSVVQVRAGDKVRVNDKLWHVDGDPEEWASPFTGRKPGRVIRIRQVRG